MCKPSFDIDLLSIRERDMLLEYLLYRLEARTRQQLMHAHPAVYNRLFQTDAMVVRARTELGTVLTAAEAA